ncbi:MAG: class I SAM-dependent methyltransferase, partial [Methanobrevibacter sp.]|nr:class I SAM-dependent methyltransferase [Methanobrevibacter sp.]
MYGDNIINFNDFDFNEIDWNRLWDDSVSNYPRKKDKNWDEIAKKFVVWEKNDDYPEKLVNAMDLDKSYNVLDLGCGEGSVTLKIASKVKSVTAVDKSGEMLKVLKSKADKSNINNIKYL